MIWLPIVGKYADIDAYASVIAYYELLQLRGEAANTYIPFAPNYSVPEGLRLPKYENHDLNLQPNDQAIILDVSVPKAINQLIPDAQILEIIDHHPGYKDYWRKRIGNKAIIEQIGAVATIIFECWEESHKTPSSQIAKLLLGAILDNTLNFNANITTERDRSATTKLASCANVSLEDFTEWYFTKVSQNVTNNLTESISDDCKTIQSPLNHTDLNFGQLTLWKLEGLTCQSAKIQSIMNSKYPQWIVSVICISERKNYLLASSENLTEYFTKLLNLSQKDDWLISDQLFLRKEIIGKMLQNRVT